MAIYGIMHTIKLKKADLMGVQIENNRTQKDKKRKFHGSDIEWEKTGENIKFRKSDNWEKSAFDLIKKHGISKVKKDSVISIQTLYSVSRDFFDKDDNGNLIYNKKADAYFRDCIRFHVKKYCGGDSRLIINAVCHLDEIHEENGAFHLHITSVPITKNERGENVLSAKRILGGKKDFVKAQQDFYDEVCKSRKMERGQSANETKRKHLDSIEYKLKQEMEKLENVYLENQKLHEKLQQQIRKFEILKTEKEEQKKQIEKNKIRLNQQIKAIEKTVVKWLKADGALAVRRKPTDAEIRTIMGIARDIKLILEEEVYTPQEKQEMQRESDRLRQTQKKAILAKEKYESLSAEIEHEKDFESIKTQMENQGLFLTHTHDFGYDRER